MTTEQIIVVVWDMALNGLSCKKIKKELINKYGISDADADMIISGTVGSDAGKQAVNDLTTPPFIKSIFGKISKLLG